MSISVIENAYLFSRMTAPSRLGKIAGPNVEDGDIEALRWYCLPPAIPGSVWEELDFFTW